MREHVGDPIMEALAVAKEAKEVSDDGVGLWSWGFDSSLFLMMESRDEEQEEDDDK